MRYAPTTLNIACSNQNTTCVYKIVKSTGLFCYVICCIRERYTIIHIDELLRFVCYLGRLMRCQLRTYSADNPCFLFIQTQHLFWLRKVLTFFSCISRHWPKDYSGAATENPLPKHEGNVLNKRFYGFNCFQLIFSRIAHPAIPSAFPASHYVSVHYGTFARTANDTQFPLLFHHFLPTTICPVHEGGASNCHLRPLGERSPPNLLSSRSNWRWKIATVIRMDQSDNTANYTLNERIRIKNSRRCGNQRFDDPFPSLSQETGR